MRVGSMIGQLVKGCSGFVHGSRLTAFKRVVGGVLKARSLVPASIGGSLPGGVARKHGVKAVDRLLKNAKLVREQPHLFRAHAAHLLGACREPVILVDWTKAVGGFECLVAATPIGGRAVPLYLEVHKQKMLSNVEVEDSFLRSLKEILPEGCTPVVVSDAGFKGPFFFSVLGLGWDFVGRVRGTAKAVDPSTGAVISKEEFYARAKTTALDLGPHELFIEHRLPCRLALIRKRFKPGPQRPLPKNQEERDAVLSARDPWLLATSIDDSDADHIVSIYRRRMQIEESFRDVKNHRYGWHFNDVRTRSINRCRVLLLVAIFAMTIATLIGMAAERAGAHRAYQANTSASRVLSLFVLACLMLHRLDFRFATVAHIRDSLRWIGPLASRNPGIN